MDIENLLHLSSRINGNRFLAKRDALSSQRKILKSIQCKIAFNYVGE